MNTHSLSWPKIFRLVQEHPAHTDVILPKDGLPHPKRAGLAKKAGVPHGQLADYRKTLPNGRSIHIREYQSYYKVHWDNHDPGTDLVGHLVHDAPEWWFSLIGAVIGSRVAEDKMEGAFVGAAVGWFLATLQSEPSAQESGFI